MLEARRGRHRLAGKRHRARAGNLADAGDHLPGRDPDSEFERTGVSHDNPPKRVLHLNGAQARAQRIVIVGNGRAKHSQHGVPDEFLERAAKVDDGFRQRLEGVVDSGSDLLRIELVHKLGVAHEIGE